MIRAQQAELAHRDAAIAQREAQLEQVKREAADQLEALRLKHQAELAAVLRRFYGPRNERFDPTQLLLFGQRVDQTPLDEASIAQEAGEELVTRRLGNRHKHGRGKLPEHLPRIRIEHDLPAEQQPCPCCGGQRHKIGEEVSEQLEYIPASFKVLQHVRFKYSCRHCEQHGTGTPIDIAEKPAQPVDKGLCGPRPARLHHHQQAGRSPAAVPPRTHLRAQRREHRPRHHVRLARRGGSARHPAGRTDDAARAAVEGDPHR